MPLEASRSPIAEKARGHAAKPAAKPRTPAGGSTPSDPPFPAATAVPSEPGMMRIELSVKSIVTILVVVGGLWVLVHVLPALMVLVTALMFLGALHPLVAWLEQRKVRRFFAICLVFAGVALVSIGLMTVTLPPLIEQIRMIAENEPKIRATLATYLEQSRFTASLADGIRNTHTTELLKSVSGTLLLLTTRVFEIVAYLVAAIFLAFYMMIDRDRLRGALYAVVPRRHHIRLSHVLLNLSTIVGGYIRGQLLTCALMGLFILVLLLACDVPNALALAVFGGFMDLLPYIGIFLTMTPVVLAALTQGTSTAIVVFLLMLAYEELESRVLVPLVYGRSLRLPSSVVFFALILGTALAGIVGALLALPIAAAVLMLVEELRVPLPGEVHLPEDTAQQRADHRTEREYERRTESLPADEAAAVAVAISVKRKKVDDLERERKAEEGR